MAGEPSNSGENDRGAPLSAPGLPTLSAALNSAASLISLAGLPAKEVAVRAAETQWARPETLARSPDSVSRVANKPRRWAVQVVAGPTLSYRTLRQPAAGGRAVVAAGEGPGLGWGAQVQGRRVLSGRWALAAGVGFQQYAARSGPLENPANTSSYLGQAKLSNTARDIYNLLVAPVQLSYALGSGGARWQVAAVGGLEPGLYLGGRSTGGGSLADAAAPVPASPTNPSTPNSAADFLAQRSYTGADASPYRAWNLGLSLGLDLRYRLAPASRWQLLVQPTGRGVVSPFARAGATDYSRHPFSLGLLTGLSWDVH